MAINPYTPVAKFEHTPYPFDEIYRAGQYEDQQFQKVLGQADNVDTRPKFRYSDIESANALYERTQGKMDKITNDLATTRDRQTAAAEIRKLQKEISDPFGEYAAHASQKALYDQMIKDIDASETYGGKALPADISAYRKSQITTNPLNWQSDTGKWDRVTGPSLPTHYGTEDYQKHFAEVSKGMKESVLKFYGDKGEGKEKNADWYDNLSNGDKVLNYQKITGVDAPSLSHVLALSVGDDMVTSAKETGRARRRVYPDSHEKAGLEIDESQYILTDANGDPILKKDGSLTFDMHTEIGRHLAAQTAAGSYVKESSKQQKQVQKEADGGGGSGSGKKKPKVGVPDFTTTSQAGSYAFNPITATGVGASGKDKTLYGIMTEQDSIIAKNEAILDAYSNPVQGAIRPSDDEVTAAYKNVTEAKWKKFNMENRIEDAKKDSPDWQELKVWEQNKDELLLGQNTDLSGNATYEKIANEENLHLDSPVMEKYLEEISTSGAYTDSKTGEVVKKGSFSGIGGPVPHIGRTLDIALSFLTGEASTDATKKEIGNLNEDQKKYLANAINWKRQQTELATNVDKFLDTRSKEIEEKALSSAYSHNVVHFPTDGGKGTIRQKYGQIVLDNPAGFVMYKMDTKDGKQTLVEAKVDLSQTEIYGEALPDDSQDDFKPPTIDVYGITQNHIDEAKNPLLAMTIRKPGQPAEQYYIEPINDQNESLGDLSQLLGRLNDGEAQDQAARMENINEYNKFDEFTGIQSGIGEVMDLPAGGTTSKMTLPLGDAVYAAQAEGGGRNILVSAKSFNIMTEANGETRVQSPFLVNLDEVVHVPITEQNKAIFEQAAAAGQVEMVAKDGKAYAQMPNPNYNEKGIIKIGGGQSVAERRQSTAKAKDLYAQYSKTYRSVGKLSVKAATMNKLTDPKYSTKLYEAAKIEATQILPPGKRGDKKLVAQTAMSLLGYLNMGLTPLGEDDFTALLQTVGFHPEEKRAYEAAKAVAEADSTALQPDPTDYIQGDQLRTQGVPGQVSEPPDFYPDPDEGK